MCQTFYRSNTLVGFKVEVSVEGSYKKCNVSRAHTYTKIGSSGCPPVTTIHSYPVLMLVSQRSESKANLTSY